LSRVSRPPADGIRWCAADLSDAGAALRVLRRIRPRRRISPCEPRERPSRVGRNRAYPARQPRHDGQPVDGHRRVRRATSDPRRFDEGAAARRGRARLALRPRQDGRQRLRTAVRPALRPSGRQPAGAHGLRPGSAGRHDARALRHRLAAAGEAPRLSSGRGEVDWVYVDDVVAAFVAAAESDKVPGSTVDVGSGRLVSIRSLVERIVALVGGDVRPAFGALPDRPGERPRVADVAPSREAIGWERSTSLDDGLACTVEWFRGACRRRPAVMAPGRRWLTGHRAGTRPGV
jgi:hypothetical protein